MVEVAKQLGHAPTLSLAAHGHVLAELAGQPGKQPAADLTLAAWKAHSRADEQPTRPAARICST